MRPSCRMAKWLDALSDRRQKALLQFLQPQDCCHQLLLSRSRGAKGRPASADETFRAVTRTIVEPCRANEPRASNGSPDFQAPAEITRSLAMQTSISPRIGQSSHLPIVAPRLQMADNYLSLTMSRSDGSQPFPCRCAPDAPDVLRRPPNRPLRQFQLHKRLLSKEMR